MLLPLVGLQSHSVKGALYKDEQGVIGELV